MTSDHLPSLLIVEDETALRHLLAVFFTEEGFTCRTADNGLTARRLVRELRPNVVLLDLLMPLESGWEVLTAWKQEGLLPDLPVLVMTGSHTVLGSGDQVLALGARASLTKPFDLQDAANAVRRLLRNASFLPPASL